VNQFGQIMIMIQQNLQLQIKPEALVKKVSTTCRLCLFNMGIDNTAVMHINKHLKPIQNMFEYTSSFTSIRKRNRHQNFLSLTYWIIFLSMILFLYGK
jgi:hypothetical protein